MFLNIKTDYRFDNRMEDKDQYLHIQLCTRDNCDFCSQYTTHSKANFWAKYGKEFGQETDVIAEKNHSLLIAGLGALTEGYVLLLPKSHYLSIGSLPLTHLLEIEQFKNQVRDAIKSVYGSAVFFEHGCGSIEKPGGACIDHAHIHGLPSEFDFRRELISEFPETKILSFSQITDVVGPEKPYLYYENQEGEMFVYHIPDEIPSQFMRRIWARSLGKKDQWDWVIYINKLNVAHTIKKLKVQLTHP